jgi:hypothetical protein
MVPFTDANLHLYRAFCASSGALVLPVYRLSQIESVPEEEFG